MDLFQQPIHFDQDLRSKEEQVRQKEDQVKPI
jgi:hypothetical protein